MTIIPVTSDYFYRTPAFDGLQYNSLATNNTYVPPTRPIEITSSGLNVTVTGNASGGALFFQGRLVLFQNETLQIPANATTSLGVTWDTSKDNEYTGSVGGEDYTPVNHQVSVTTAQNFTAANINDTAVFAGVKLANIVASASTVSITKNLKVFTYDNDIISTETYQYQGFGDYVYMNGRFDITVPGGSTTVNLDTLPGGRRPAKQLAHWVKLDQNDAKLIITPDGVVMVELNFFTGYQQDLTCDIGTLTFARAAGIDTN